MQAKKLIVLLVVLLLGNALSAQVLDTTLMRYRSNFQQEKVHIHFDKTVYNKGETVWFKAYIMAGDSLSDYSRNFYLDIYSDSGTLIKHTVHPIFESSARGSFDIPQQYREQVIHVKAYTRWMLNFDKDLLFLKDIQIAQANASSSAKKITAFASLKLFPEGGDLIAGLESNVAFLATDQSGKPVAIRGAILNGAKQLVDSFQSVHNGMGSFSINPDPQESYTCHWEDQLGNSHITELPKTKAYGLVVSAKLINGKLRYGIKRSSNSPDNFKSLHVVVSMNQQLLYKANVSMISKLSVAGEFPTDDFQTGILQLTIFDASWIPIAERIVFVNTQRHQFFPQLELETKRTIKRGKNTWVLTVPDSILSNLSVSITDANLHHDSSTNIFTQFLLSGELKGYIHQPEYYFSDKTSASDENLDLVMLTHGWRRYHWEDIAKGKLPHLAYPMDSDYVQIKGRIISGDQSSYKPGQTISLVMQAKDSSKQYFVLPITPDGSFNQRGIIFFDTAKVFYQLTGIKNMRNNVTANFQYGLPVFPYASNAKFSAQTIADTNQLKHDNFFYQSKLQNKRAMDSVVILKEVVVESKLKSPTDVLDEKYTTGLFTNKNGYAFDVMHDDRSQGQLDLFHYLQNLIPGMSMSLPMLGQNGAEEENSNNVAGLNWRDGTPDIFLNEMPSSAEIIQGLQMSDIAYVKFFRPPFMGAGGSGASGAIAVYTKKGNDMSTDRVQGLNNAILSGYSAYKEFYQPDYAFSPTKYADLRPTLYWNPYVLTDKKNKQFKIEFYNNDITQKFRIIVEGVNAAGKMARLEKLID
ncbi:MAG TPA: hypothetical protein PLZ97_00615 [Sediminibacterium sp.]|nr:hypothetical protein [Sediminibacterium sp.]